MARSGDLFATESADGVDWQKVYGSKELGAAVFEVAEKLCDRIGIINKGKLVYEGTMEEINS